MRQAFLTFVVCASLMAFLSFGDEVRIGGVNGTNIQTFNNAIDAGGTGSGAKLAFQVRDGGCTFYRAGCGVRNDGGVTCVVDAGPGDPYVCFSNNGDPYKVDMPSDMDRLNFRANDNTTAVQVDVFKRRP